MSHLKWCCEGFKNAYHTGGERGFSIIIEKIEIIQKPAFFIQYRAIDILEKFEEDLEYKISLASQISISYCPWCTRNLSKWYKKNIDEMIRPEFQLPYEF